MLASDSETIGEQEPQNFGAEPRGFAGEQRGFAGEQQLVEPGLAVLDISETQSEGAWSTDVLASDTERLTEVDNDDIASVARSDDASSVARSDDVTRSEGDENLQGEQNGKCLTMMIVYL